MDNEKIIQILYKNWKGETKLRNILPLSIEFKSTNWHKDAQWILNAIDIEKNEERGFAIKDIKNWSNNF